MTARAARISLMLLALAGPLRSGAAAAAPGTTETPLIPLETIFGNPERISPAISPDGLHLAYLAPEDSVLNIWVRTLGGADDHVITHDRDRGITSFQWSAGSDHLLYLADRNGDENAHLFAVPLAGGDPVDLTPKPGVKAELIAIDHNFPNEILVAMNNRIPSAMDAYRINVATGNVALEVQNDIGAVRWFADHTFTIRAALVPTPDGGMILKHRASADAPWTDLLTWGSDDALVTQPIGFASDNRELYMVSSQGSNSAELREIDTATGSERRLAIDPGSDVSDVIMSPLFHRFEAVAFARDRVFWRAMDAPTRLDLPALATLCDGDLSVVSQDDTDHHWIVSFTRDSGPVTYYVYDRETRKGSLLFSARPGLDHVTLAAMKPITYLSTDSLTIHAYLSLPPGREPTMLPAVLDVHGGPWARDNWGYNPEAQWLASRGYAVLQVNFRGSTGYGKRFLDAGDREWGGKMQDDLTNGVKWLVDQGIADPHRVAIFGASYGGYAALSGLTTTPDLYACGVDVVGPSNLLSWITSLPDYWKPMRDIFYRRIGNPETDAPFLKSRSPLFAVDRIRAPLLIAQGANDPRVNREESIQIRDALEKAGKTVQYLEFPDEGHGFRKPANRLAFYRTAETFLAKYLGGRSGS